MGSIILILSPAAALCSRRPLFIGEATIDNRISGYIRQKNPWAPIHATVSYKIS